jgi:hypothetical protein
VFSSQAPARREIVQLYDGPRCPRCDAKLTKDWIRTGTVECPDCRGTFEATAFEPLSPVIRIAPVAGTGIEESNVCANHARNTATTNCSRCGLFICALCDMNVGSGSLCPSCFDRVRAEGSLPTAARRIRDYQAMARVSAVAGLLFMFAFVGPLIGILSLVYQAKARGQRRRAGEKIWGAGPVIVMILSIVVLIGGTLIDGFLIYGLMQHPK